MMSHFVKVLLGLSIMLSVPVWASEVVFIDAPEEGVELGLGWDRTTSTIVPSRCVNYAPIQEGGQILNLDLQEVSSSTELAQAMKVSASTMVSGLLGSGSARFSLTQNQNIKASSTSFSLRATAQNGTMFAGPVKPLPDRRFAFSALANRLVPIWMKDELEDGQHNLAVVLHDWAKDLLEQDEGERLFRRHCGDHFISAITSGAEVLAVITFETRDEQTKKNLSAGIKAAYSIASSEVDMDLDEDKSAKSSNLQVFYVQVGGSRGVIPSSNEDLKRKLSVLAAEAAEAPMFYEIGIMKYEDLPDWPGVSHEPGPHDEINSVLSNRSLELLTLYNTLAAVLDKPGDYLITDEELFIPRLRWLEVLQDRVLAVRKLIAEFQSKRQQHELNRLAGRALGDTSDLLAIGNRLAGFEWGALNPVLLQDKTDDYQRNLTNVIEYLKSLQVPKLRLLLPLPHVPRKNQNYADSVVEYYVGKQAKRVCKRAPLDEGCLSNQQLRDLRNSVFPNYQALPLNYQGGGYLFTTNPALRGCLHVNDDFTQTAIVSIPKEATDLSAHGCTLFQFERLTVAPQQSYIKSGVKFLTRDGVRVYLAEASSGDESQQRWSIYHDHMIGGLVPVNTGTTAQCISAEQGSARQVGLGDCQHSGEADTRGWFIIPPVLF